MSKSCVLLVDDNAEILSLYEIVISRSEFEIFTARSADQAMDIYIREKERIALVVTDGEMPKYDGIWLARNIRAHDSHGAKVPIVLISGSIGKYENPEGMSYFNRRFLKPASAEMLQLALELVRQP